MPAEVSWMSPRVRISVFDIESVLFGIEGELIVRNGNRREKRGDCYILFEFTRNDV